MFHLLFVIIMIVEAEYLISFFTLPSGMKCIFSIWINTVHTYKVHTENMVMAHCNIIIIDADIR